MLPKASRQPEIAAFHEGAIFCGIWLLVVLVGVHTLKYLSSVLIPLLWAFFLMMGLLPLTDRIHKGILIICNGRCFKRRAQPSLTGRDAEQEIESENDSKSDTDESQQLTSQQLTSRQHSDQQFGYARMVAVLIVIVLFVGSCFLFFYTLYISVTHMSNNMQYYQKGQKRITERINNLSHDVPKQYLEKGSEKFLEYLEGLVSDIMELLVTHVTSTLVDVLTVLLYMMFWLFEPFHISSKVTGIMAKYWRLKALASLGYAFFIWLVLHILRVDLSFVFGVITFCFNFIPEIGPIFAMILPLPVILFDGRLDNPMWTCALAFAAQLVLKFIFGNFVEVKLVESHDDMRMHPVIILFFVAFFYFIWGSAGMLLSVPIVAIAKAVAFKMPEVYKNQMLIFIEGDKDAPERWNAELSTAASDDGV